ncbi:MAG: MmcQ/YjbR family DNA-binding protein [Rhodospirillales bacterium]|nr:MAG: MmcQ/YjbR family DNA-binding protein [Rhodospirillales bacterium]
MTPAAIDAYCRSLPAATLVVQWEGVSVFKVGGRMFAMMPPARERRGARELWFKCVDAHYEAMSAAPGFRPCPYLARARWVAVAAPARLPAAQTKAYLARAHATIVARLPRKTQIALGFTPPPRPPARRRRVVEDDR